MHVLFVHKNFPAQFGHIASHLVRNAVTTRTVVTLKAPAKRRR